MFYYIKRCFELNFKLALLALSIDIVCWSALIYFVVKEFIK